MTYFGFLIRFVLLPIGLLALFLRVDQRRGVQEWASLRALPVWQAIALHMVVALLYTTPWDNYLVATGVWFYDPKLVTGIVFGWVPIEEYTFFLVQPILTGLWLWVLLRRLQFPPNGPAPMWHKIALPVLALVWVGSVAVLAVGWKPGTYLALELGWALPPIMLQIFFGWDILWRYGRLVLTVLLTSTLYLSLADYLAIGSGTWAIDPAQSVPVLIAGVLPLEELLFFLLTNTLLTLGITLLLAQESHERFAILRAKWFGGGR